MKQNFVILLLLLPFSLFSQIKINPGIGIANNVHFFQYDKETFPSTSRSLFKNLVGFNAFLHLSTKNKFQFRTNLHLGAKRVALFDSYIAGTGIGSVRETIQHGFLATDLSCLGYYQLNASQKNQLEVLLGFYLSLNLYANTSYSNATSSAGNTGGSFNGGIFPSDIEIVDSPFIFYAGINTGISYRITETKRSFEIYLLTYLSPLNLFEMEFTSTNDLWGNFAGRYHHLSLGVNIFLKKNKS